MVVIQEVKQKVKNKIYKRYIITLDKTFIERFNIKKGDKLHFNGTDKKNLLFILETKKNPFFKKNKLVKKQ